jgi:hypothetical protein
MENFLHEATADDEVINQNLEGFKNLRGLFSIEWSEDLAALCG